jgi:hypothetical protein
MITQALKLAAMLSIAGGDSLAYFLAHPGLWPVEPKEYEPMEVQLQLQDAGF